jgi:hypothetical protein
MSEPIPSGDPMTAMAEAAASMHELYTQYVAAGFTPGIHGEAMHLLVELMKTNFQPPPS